MRRMLRAAASLAPVLFAVLACNGTTGDQLITFSAYASGASGAAGPFTTYDASGKPAYTVQLTRAKMHLGALYFDQSPPSSGFDSPTCITPDLYAAQVPGGIDVDLLSTTPQPFATAGNGSLTEKFIEQALVELGVLATADDYARCKTALLAGAFDERVAMVIPLQAGCGGTAPSRGKVGVNSMNRGFL